MSAVLYTSPYVPAEWIAAHGLKPCRVMPDGRGRAPTVFDRQGVCPYVRCFASEVMASADARGIVVTTVCDQMRRAFDVVACKSKSSAFLLNVPATWQTPGARELYLDEFRRLSDFLVRLGGARPSSERLAEVMRRYGRARVCLDDLRRALSPRQFAEAAAEFGRTGQITSAAEPRTVKASTPGVPVALVGGPLREVDLEVFDVVEQCGGRVTLDATETGERGWCRPFESLRLADHPFEELADAYFDGIQDISRRPNDGFYEWLDRRLKERDVRAIILRRYVWCDLWHAELVRLRQRCGLAVLDLDTDGEQLPGGSRDRTRIGAFLEMLA